MRLLTARSEGGYMLHVETGSGYIAASSLLKGQRGQPRKFADVGELLRADGAYELLREALAKIANTPVSAVPFESFKLGPPVLAPSKLICLGHNYREHAAEGGHDLPTEPLLFAKTTNTLIGSDEPVRRPPMTQQLDYEGELGLVIGRRAVDVSEARALDYVAGFTIVNDISARDVQHGVSQWFLGKSFDTFAPIGPFLTSPDAVPVPAEMRLETRVNGEVRQSASCADMIFPPASIVAFISRRITLEPGDVIATGTPAGIGMVMNPPRFLVEGDIVEVTITGLGQLRSQVEVWGRP